MKKIEENKNGVIMNYRGYNIVKSNRIEGWYMTECGAVCGESVDEVIYDLDDHIKDQYKGQKVTVYFKSDLGMGIVKIEGKLVDYGTRPWAQYGNAAYVDIIPKGKRKARRYQQSYDPFMVILAGHGHPDMEDGYEVVSESADVVVKKSKYTAFDPQWGKDADNIINGYLETNEVTLLANYRKSAGFDTYPKYYVNPFLTNKEELKNAS